MFMSSVRIKRVYEPAAPEDGQRILVDRLWPRGMSKERAQIVRWAKEVAPSAELFRHYHHDKARWLEFRERYMAELDENPEVDRLLAEIAQGTVTLVYAAKDEQHNNAVVLKEYLESRIG